MGQSLNKHPCERWGGLLEIAEYTKPGVPLSYSGSALGWAALRSQYLSIACAGRFFLALLDLPISSIFLSSCALCSPLAQRHRFFLEDTSLVWASLQCPRMGRRNAIASSPSSGYLAELRDRLHQLWYCLSLSSCVIAVGRLACMSPPSCVGF